MKKCIVCNLQSVKSNVNKYCSYECYWKSMIGSKKKPHSLETKKKMSLACMGEKNHQFGLKESAEHVRYRLRNSKGMTGKNHTEETKKKLSQYWIGSKSPNWRGGCSYKDYPLSWTKQLKREIRKRDNYNCYICKTKQTIESLDVHHIDYNKQNCSKNNLISLCGSCHSKTNFNRDYWIEYFKINIKNNKNGKIQINEAGIMLPL